MKLSGELGWRHQTLSLDKIVVNAADSSVKATGTIGEQIDLDLRLRSNELADLYPDIHGALTASGSLHGNLKTPLIKFELSGKELAWQDYAIGTIKAKGKMDLFEWQQVTLDADAETLMLSGQSLEALQIKLTGEKINRLSLHITHQAASLQLDAEGRLVEQTWRGSLNRIQIDSKDYGIWRQKQASNLSISVDQLAIEPFCLVSNTSTICLSLKREQQLWQGSLEGKDISLAILSPLLSDQFQLHGAADINLQAGYSPNQSLFGNGQLRLKPGKIDFVLVDGEINSWEYQQGKIDFTLDHKGLNTTVSLDINAEDYLKFNAVLANFDALAFDASTQEIDSSVEISFSQINLFQNLLDEAHEFKGNVRLQAHAQGLLTSPRVEGRLSLTDGSMNIPRLGLDVTNINLSASSKGRQVDYELSAVSGDGRLTANGQTQLQPDQGWPTQIQIKGENVRISNIPEARIDVSPDIKLKIQHRRIDADGTVNIPYAKLQPKDISSADLPSDDVIIHGGDQVQPEKWDIYSSIRLILGNRVTFYGFGFEGRIAGDLLLIDEPNKPSIGVGELNVAEGRYRAYGQRLDIERGRLLFASSPLNNPGLDLRAVRKVQDVTAGITVSGTLRAPTFSIFSTPAMGQTNALSYLILGRPLDQKSDSDSTAVANAALALGLSGGDFLVRKIGDRLGLDEVRVESSDAGEASLIMGRYLSPRLYISYGVGVIDAVNTLNLRYEISQHWQLTAESGNALGADIQYTIER